MTFSVDPFDPLREGKVSLPCPKPLAEAVEFGLFGAGADGSCLPSPAEVAAMTEEHARELLVTLLEEKHLHWCLKYSINPRNGCRLGTGTRRDELEKAMRTKLAKLSEHCAGCLDAYASTFGWEAADRLEAWVRELLIESAFQETPMETQPWLF